MNDEEITIGNLVTKKITRPAIEVDCSKWVDTSSGGWTSGSFVTKKITRPAVEAKLSIPSLRLKVSFQPSVSPAALEAATKAMIEKLLAAAPDLDLAYDPAQSGLEVDSQGATVAVLALIARTPNADIDQRYAELFDLARTVRDELTLKDVALVPN